MPQRIRAGCDAKHIHTDGKRNPLPQRIRAGCDWLKEYGTITAQLCHSAFVRVATVAPHSLSRLSIFATAHSCGLRPSRGALLNLILILCHSAFVRVATEAFDGHVRLEILFATAHSCGLRRLRKHRLFARKILCHSAFVRVATDRCMGAAAARILCHSAFVRVATRPFDKAYPRFASLPQRIRAGCDLRLFRLPRIRLALCHSAFVRVATKVLKCCKKYCSFATAHSCGLRHGGNDTVSGAVVLCHSAFVRVATFHAQGAYHTAVGLCHSAFVRVATAEKQCSALRICCEKVDSFSSVGESGLALTIFPFSFAAKATYVAINDSFGRAIDRFFWCEPHRN